MRARGWAAALAMGITGCLAHEQKGDRAAASGEWRQALEEYREAISKDPGSASLPAKFQKAQREAAARAYRSAQLCAESGDWECAAEALRYTGKLPVTDADVVALGVSARASVASRAAAAAEQARGNHQYPQALALLQVAVSLDPRFRERLEVARREYDEFLRREVERLIREGDLASQAKSWDQARLRYEAANKLVPGGRARWLAQYAVGMATGEAALRDDNVELAINGYKVAVSSGQDRDGAAARLLEKARALYKAQQDPPPPPPEAAPPDAGLPPPPPDAGPPAPDSGPAKVDAAKPDAGRVSFDGGKA